MIDFDANSKYSVIVLFYQIYNSPMFIILESFITYRNIYTCRRVNWNIVQYFVKRKGFNSKKNKTRKS